MPRKPALQEVISTLRFPLGGIDLSAKPSGQHPGTTAIGNNVRGFEPLTKRARGGARPGIRRYIDETVAGTHYIQHLNYIVTNSAEAVGAAFDGVDLGDLGGLDPGNLGGLEANEFSGWGGGGYQPAKPRAPFRLSLAVTAVGTGGTLGNPASVPADGNTTATITATLKDFAGGAQAGDNIVLHTNPSGRVGDGSSGVTSVGGTLTFNVTDSTAETVTYSASDTTNPLNSVNQVRVQFKAVANPLLKASTHNAPPSLTDNVTLTATILTASGTPLSGHTVVLSTSPSGRDGDGDSGVANASGKVIFQVHDNIEETVTYRATDTTANPDTVSLPVSVTYASAPGFVILLRSPDAPDVRIDFLIDGTFVGSWQNTTAFPGATVMLATPGVVYDSGMLGPPAVAIAPTTFLTMPLEAFEPGAHVMTITGTDTLFSSTGLLLESVAFDGSIWNVDTVLVASQTWNSGVSKNFPFTV